MHVDAEPALILHARAYRETSLLLECLTPAHGRIGLIARGIRSQRSRLPRGLLQPLQPLQLSWTGKGELGTLTRAEASAAPIPVHGERLYSAMYVNELVTRLCARGDPHSELYEHYLRCLLRLSSGQPEGWTLRRFERDLLIDLGYGLVLDRDCQSNQPLDESADYVYVIDSGPRPWDRDEGSLRVSGTALLALERDEMPDPERCAELRLLMRGLLQHQLGGASLNAWTMRMRSPLSS